MDSTTDRDKSNNKKLIFSDLREEIAKINPFEEFKAWLGEAQKSELNDPNAASVASVDSEGLPNVRILLLKGLDERGFAFYTNFNSVKAQEIIGQKKAALCFHWKTLRAQVRVRGTIEEIAPNECDAYFATRSRGSRIGAWASLQSSELERREVLEARAKQMEEKFAGQEVLRPPHWRGFRIQPLSIEFWQDGEFRLHDRVIFKRKTLADPWDFARYYP